MGEMVNRREIQWFPGHMMKTLRALEKEIHNIDAVIMLLDARIPRSSLNPLLVAAAKNKPVLYLLNKADLADERETQRWEAFYKKDGNDVLPVNSKTGKDTNKVKQQIDAKLEALLARRGRKGMQGAKIFLMVLGIPNVGKSTFINTFCGAAKAKAANKPGVTRGKQWISFGQYELLDIPGISMKKFETPVQAANLAFIGSINDGILDKVEVAANILDEIKTAYGASIAAHYGVDETLLELNKFELLEAIGKKKGLLMRGGEVDIERTATMVLSDFRAAKLGRVTLERCV